MPNKPKTVYVPPPVSPHAHLDQLRQLWEVFEGEDVDTTLGPMQKMLAKMALGPHGLRKLRVMHIEEMVAAGYNDTQIYLAFATPDSDYALLITHLKGNDSRIKFSRDIKAARDRMKESDVQTRRDWYIQSRQRLLEAAWAALGRVDPSNTKALLELIDKLTQDIAEAHGVLNQRTGKRPSTRRGGRDIVQSDAVAEATETTAASEDTEPDWGGEEFKADEQDNAEDQESE